MRLPVGRVCNETLTVPDQHPGIQFIIEAGRTARDMAPGCWSASLFSSNGDDLGAPAGSQGAEGSAGSGWGYAAAHW